MLAMTAARPRPRGFLSWRISVSRQPQHGYGPSGGEHDLLNLRTRHPGRSTRGGALDAHVLAGLLDGEFQTHPPRGCEAVERQREGAEEDSTVACLGCSPMTERRCVDCGVDISGRSNSAKRCETHSKEAQRIWYKARYAEHREKMKAKSRTHYATHAEEINAQAKAYRAAHPEKQKARKKSYYAAHYEEINAQAKEWHAAHPEKTKAARKKWAAAHPEKQKACDKSWRAANIDKFNATRRAWYAAHPEKGRTSSKVYRAANPEKVKALSKAYLAEHPEKYREYANKRRARKLDQLGSVTPGVGRVLLEKQRNRCAAPHCRKQLRDRTTWHIDHIMPLVLGGLHDDANLQLLCAHCNVSKHAKHPDDWLKQHGELPLER